MFFFEDINEKHRFNKTNSPFPAFCPQRFPAPCGVHYFHARFFFFKRQFLFKGAIDHDRSISPVSFSEASIFPKNIHFFATLLEHVSKELEFDISADPMEPISETRVNGLGNIRILHLSLSLSLSL